MMQELIEIHKRQVGIQERQVNIETQNVGIQNQQTEILKMMAEAMNRPLELRLPELSQVLSQLSQPSPLGTPSANLAENDADQTAAVAEAEIIIDEKPIVVKDVKEVARQWFLEDESRLKLSLREAAALSGISKSTLGRVKQELTKKG